ncbi:hypothetical protein AC1031_016812 [Aphanomyces cochlioides]|nr:hypothetical protein AC1031_016812 [Aphanomyces cochlioides]
MLKVACVVVGEGRPFIVKTEALGDVDELKDKIKEKKMYQFGSDMLDLYRVDGLVQTSKTQFCLERTVIDDLSAKTLSDFDGFSTEMVEAFPLSEYFQESESSIGKIHVLVVVRRGAVLSICPRISVTDLLRHNLLPEMEFVDAMEQLVGFRIPILSSTYVSMWPDTFTRGEVEYGASIDAFLEHGLVSDNSTWLTLFRHLCFCTIYHDETHESSSAEGTRPHTAILKGDAMVGICETKASEKNMATAMMELMETMPEAAYLTFPHGRTSIPVWTTSSTLIRLYQLSYSPTTGTYTSRLLKWYHVTNDTCRRDFVVDLFKILKWVFAIQKPNASMHLVPQVRAATPNGHYVTWLKTSLVKEFKAGAEINMELIERIYSADLQHVERGICNHNSVTITSIGRTLRDALIAFRGKRHLIIDGVKKALEELHSIGVAHCDVRAANVFDLLGDRRVIFGDLEYCRPLDAPPPDVKRKHESCKTALELDNYQFGRFVDELARR